MSVNRFSNNAIRFGLVALLVLPIVFGPISVTFGFIGAAKNEPRAVMGLVLGSLFSALGFFVSTWIASQISF